VLILVSPAGEDSPRIVRVSSQDEQLQIHGDSLNEPAELLGYHAVQVPRADLRKGFRSWILLNQKETGRVASAGLIFESIGRGASSMTEPSSPLVIFSSSESQAKAFFEWIRPEHESSVRRVDWSERFVLAVFRGAEAWSGFDITVRQIEVKDGQLIITVLLKDPEPSGNALPGFTSAYDIVSVAKSRLTAEIPSRWVLVTGEGRVLARSS
jgi:hypothetical protein